MDRPPKVALARARRAGERAREALARATVTITRARRERARSEAAGPGVRGWFERARRLAEWQARKARRAIDAAETEIIDALLRLDRAERRRKGL